MKSPRSVKYVMLCGRFKRGLLNFPSIYKFVILTEFRDIINQIILDTFGSARVIILIILIEFI